MPMGKNGMAELFCVTVRNLKEIKELKPTDMQVSRSLSLGLRNCRADEH
jgi:hypothetical protein